MADFLTDILESTNDIGKAIALLKAKAIEVPSWSGRDALRDQYDPKRHPVMNKTLYPDEVNDDGRLEPMTRITYDLQRLAVKRMSELVCGIPVKRIYKAESDKQNEIAKRLEAIFQRNRINSVNVERTTSLFASCEVVTLWYAVEQPNTIYGFDCPLKFRCRNFSPMQGDSLYPLFDEYGDMVAMSVAYTRKVNGNKVSYFDVYTEDRHIKFSTADHGWGIEEDEQITLGKIPAIYGYRPTPIWEDTSRIVYEMEWAMSRNGNYLRKNSKPLFVVIADEVISYGDEEDENKGKAVMQYPKGSTAQYVTWTQAVENLKFYISELRNTFFTQLQLPDWSYEKMSQQALSGESRKQLFVDAQLKVKDESGRLVEFFDREVNVVKAFLKSVSPQSEWADIDALEVENEITPFTITDDKDTITNLMTANGNKPIISQREAVEFLGWSNDVDKTLQEINEESAGDVMGTDFI